MLGFKQHINKPKEQKHNKYGDLGSGFLSTVTPRKGYVFFSDYFKIDDQYATIATIFHRDGSDRNMYPMWGVNLLPRNLGNDVTARLFTQIQVADSKWVQEHIMDADNRQKAQDSEAAKSGKSKDRRMNLYHSIDIDQVNDDIIARDSYMYVTFKELIKAPSLKELDMATNRIQRNYDKSFGGFYLDHFEGQQRTDLKNLMVPASEQIGKPMMFTASELAGEYNIVTQGISDDFGEYVGTMKGDINNNAVLWDIDDFSRSVVIASNDPAETVSEGVDFPANTRGSGMWGVKLAQSALIDNHRVIHLVLNGCQVPKIGINLDNISTYVAMQNGAINPFEMFGEVEDELSVFPAQLNKLELMAKQISPSLTDIDLNLHLNQLLTRFYEDLGMWHDNAKNFRKDLKLVGLPHKQYPLLEKFNAYLDERLAEAKNANNSLDVHSIERLQSAFTTMLNSNGDLFDQSTDESVDGANQTQQVVYDFSKLIARGSHVMMAQFVNALSFATGNLQKGDLLIIHGMDVLQDDIFGYFNGILSRLLKQDVRIAFLYDDIDVMLNQTHINRFADADWVLTGTMPQASINKYQQELDLQVPKQLAEGLTSRDAKTYFLRRGTNNILFNADVVLDEY